MTNNLLSMPDDDESLFGEVAGMIERARTHVAAQVNSDLVLLYWGIGKRIREDVLDGERAEYGADVVKRLATRLTERYGRGYAWRNLMRMTKLAESYPDPTILSPLATKLTWTNICEALTIADQGKRDFYLAFAARERWS